jgi:hypothetical protein
VHAAKGSFKKGLEYPPRTDKEDEMTPITPEQEKQILNASPKGTWALLLVIAAAMVMTWAAMFMLFLSHGPVN